MLPWGLFEGEERGLPKADFRLRGDAFDPLAPVKVLAVMCHPTDVRNREGMLRALPSRITIPRGQGAGEMASDLWLRELWDEYAIYRRQGGLAGALVLALTQVRSLNCRADPEIVLTLAARIAQQWMQLVDLETPGTVKAPSAAPSEAAIVEAYRAFATVAHLWAALVYGALRKQPELQPHKTQTLPTFLAYAEEIARLASSVEWEGGASELAFTAEAAWNFILPERLRKTARAQFGQTPAVQSPVPGAAAGRAAKRSESAR